VLEGFRPLSVDEVRAALSSRSPASADASGLAPRSSATRTHWPDVIEFLRRAGLDSDPAQLDKAQWRA
jgi:hypothetical protein